ncbi:pyridoxal phosphate-dependent aminotransferase [Costertonia aggregata]|uniref:Histidinol-phosphate aminotransferase family protein n=1 Tax=Costertonia aggregata TaxID=343403 RepID=A0A7H9AKK1_9FLAO|nr:histidinol-phosphate transaminase [Costertonia aggregata]QLG43958.1 histidinol-phosphate aminotransferase family protein [Costertonia aggregata]
METNDRRNWLKQVGLGIAGFGLASMNGYGSETILPEYKNHNNVPILLGSNENPYGPSELAKKAILESLSKNNRYGMNITMQLAESLAKKNGLSKNNILMSPGSSAILDLVAQFASLQKGNFITAEPTFNYWGSAAEALGLNKISIPLTRDKQHDLDAMFAAIDTNTQLVYVCNPNNPTGTLCDESELRSFVKKATEKTLVLLDEAYLEFTDQNSLSDMLTSNQNLIITKTFSKIYGLAGARVGYALANENLMRKIKKLRTWSGIGIGVVSSSAALATLYDVDFTERTRMLNQKARAYTIKQLEQLNIKCIPSYTNFIYFSLADYTHDFFDKLKKANITGTRVYEEDGQWSRISIGTMEEMKYFIRALG